MLRCGTWIHCKYDLVLSCMSFCQYITDALGLVVLCRRYAGIHRDQKNRLSEKLPERRLQMDKERMGLYYCCFFPPLLPPLPWLFPLFALNVAAIATPLPSVLTVIGFATLSRPVQLRPFAPKEATKR